MAASDLKIRGVKVESPPPVAAAAAVEAEPGSKQRVAVSVEVENNTGAARYAWASPRQVDYDPASKVLTILLAEKPLQLPPGVILLSDHPKIPRQVEIGPNGRATIEVKIPPFIRRAAPDGHGWIEDPIGEIDQVEVEVQHSSRPVEPVKPHEKSADIRKRMLDQGAVTKATVATKSPRRKNTK